MLIILKISTAKQLNTKYIFPEERLSQQPFRSTLPCSIKLSRAFVKSFYIIPVIEAKLRKTSFCFSFTYTHDPIPALKLTAGSAHHAFSFGRQTDIQFHSYCLNYWWPPTSASLKLQHSGVVGNFFVKKEPNRPRLQN